MKLIVFCFTLVLTSMVFANGENFTLEEHWYTQPVDHSEVDGETFQQQFLTLKPADLQSDYKVFFILGNESDSTASKLKDMYRAYGSPDDMVFIFSEHRGYGQSITAGAQTKPDYVSVDQALTDYHRLIEHLKPQHPVPWIAAGYSYGGALVINFSFSYPDDVDVILSSSPPTKWGFQIPEYSEQVPINLGDAFSQRLGRHVSNLTPEALYDDNWQKREYITTVIAMLSQRHSMQFLTPLLSTLSYLPTPLFSWSLETLLPDEAKLYVTKRMPGEITHEESKKGNLMWRTWKYQQCSEIGNFFGGFPFSYTRNELIEDCRMTFGEEPASAEKNWDVNDMIPKITVPHVSVSGGRDPWARMGITPGHGFENVTLIYEKDRFHCEDKAELELGVRVMSVLRDQLQ